tara:strand:+ start:5227 stop:6519 length:1293 start_codon:yes stop_codon:yes gene_type:complete
MKKKLLFCIQNPFALDNLFEDIKFLQKSFDITILTTNYLINEDNKEKYENFRRKAKIENLFFLPFYKKGKTSRNIKSMFCTHIFLKNLKKKINFQNFDVCISDGKFFIWQRIILDQFIKKEAIQIGLVLDPVLLPLKEFKELLDGGNVNDITKKLHKLREVKSLEKKKNSILKRFQNVYIRQRDLLFDRKVLSTIFHKNEFSYKESDFRLMETDRFDYKLCFFYSSYYFWEKIYSKKCFLIKLKNDCSCDERLIQKKGKALFLSTMWSNYKKHENFLEEKIDRIVIFFDSLKKKNKHLYQLDFRFHPMENKEIIYQVKDLILKKNLSFVKFEVQNTPLYNLVCNYSYVIGALSGSLSYVKNFCNNIDVYCLKSLSENYSGEYYYLKLINEKIKHYDDINDKFEDENKFLSQNDLNVKASSLSQFLSSITN